MATQSFFCVPMELFDLDLSAGAMRLLLVFLSFRNFQTGECSLRFKTLREREGGKRSLRSLYRDLKELKDKGFIEVKGHRGPRQYVLTNVFNLPARQVPHANRQMPRSGSPHLPSSGVCEPSHPSDEHRREQSAAPRRIPPQMESFPTRTPRYEWAPKKGTMASLEALARKEHPEWNWDGVVA